MEKGTTEDEMVGWHHRLDGHAFEHAPGAGDGQGGLECCSPWGRKESDLAEPLNGSLPHHRSTQLRTQQRLTWRSKPALLCPLVVDEELAPRCVTGPCNITYLKQEHSVRGVIQTDPKSGWELGHNYFFLLLLLINSSKDLDLALRLQPD